MQFHFITYDMAVSGGGGTSWPPYSRWRARAAGQGMIFRSSPLTQDIEIGLIGFWRATPLSQGWSSQPGS